MSYSLSVNPCVQYIRETQILCYYGNNTAQQEAELAQLYLHTNVTF